MNEIDLIGLLKFVEQKINRIEDSLENIRKVSDDSIDLSKQNKISIDKIDKKINDSLLNIDTRMKKIESIVIRVGAFFTAVSLIIGLWKYAKPILDLIGK